MTDYCYGCVYKKTSCKNAPEYIHKRCTYYNNDVGRIKIEYEINGIEMKAEDRE